MNAPWELLIDELLTEEGSATLSSAVSGPCLQLSRRVRSALGEVGKILQIHRVIGRQPPVVHYHLRTPEDMIIDPTWQQFLDGHMCKDVPRIFVGTREVLIVLLENIDPLLPFSRGQRLTPEAFVDIFYGEGIHAHTRTNMTGKLVI